VATEISPSIASPESRIEQISLRLTELRSHAQALSERVHDATAQAAHIRSTAPINCHHASDVRRLTDALAQVEHELEGLRMAMSTRGVIEQAKGMLMLREGCDAEAAFETLVDLSQHSHRKLIEVARTMVESWSSGEHAGS
jgi:AmiR/NasT family two-component response regulator